MSSKLLDFKCVAPDIEKAANFYRANKPCTHYDWSSYENRELCKAFESVAGGGSSWYKHAQDGFWKFLPIHDQVPIDAWSETG
jgi:hypothetical protein